MDIDLDLIHAKIRNIQNCLNSIKQYTKNFDTSTIDDIMVQDLVVVNLERAAQACVDIASHIVSRKAMGVPLSMSDVFFLLHKNSYISQDLSRKMMNMIGFRNIAVHEYEQLDIEIVKSIIKNNLCDFEDFYKAVLERVKAS